MPFAVSWGLIGLVYNPFRSFLRDATSAKTNHPRPELYLFSDGDKLMDADKIASFVSKRAQNGANVTMVRFKDSPHVQHYRYYPDRYRQSLSKFMLPQPKL